MQAKPPKSPFYLIDVSHPFYKPLGVRVAIVATALVWTVMEVLSREVFWVIIAGALAAYSVYVLIIRYTPPAETPGVVPSEPDGTDDDMEQDSDAKIPDRPKED